MNKKYNKVIGIQCYGTSGTTLMHSLIDNHPSIMGLPYLHARDLYTLWTDHIVGSGRNIEGANELHEYDEKNLKNVSLEKIVEKIKELRPYFFDHTRGLEESLTRVGENQDKILTVNEDEFLSYVKDFFKDKEINRKNYIISIFVAFNKCFNFHHDENPYICIPIHDHSIEIVRKIKEDFDFVKTITMVRNPVKCIGSLLKHINYNQHKYCLFKSHLNCALSVQILQKRHHYETKPFKLYGKNPYFPDSESYETRYVKLENVHNNVEKEMKKISQWLKIDFREELLESTFMGYKWFNRKESIKVSGANKKVTNQKYERFMSVFDFFRIKYLCMNELKYFGYYKFRPIEKFMYILLPFLILIPFKIDFNLTTFKYRIKSLFNIFSENKDVSILKWIILDKTDNTIFGPHLEEMSLYFPEKTSFNVGLMKPKRIFNSLICFPVLFLRFLYNYIHLRTIMLIIIYKIIFNKKYTESYVNSI